jgi:hypothetical protein
MYCVGDRVRVAQQRSDDGTEYLVTEVYPNGAICVISTPGKAIRRGLAPSAFRLIARAHYAAPTNRMLEMTPERLAWIERIVGSYLLDGHPGFVAALDDMLIESRGVAKATISQSS